MLDTDVIVAAMRSPLGGSAGVLALARAGRVTPVASVALALEYQAVCLRPRHLEAAGLSLAQGRAFVSTVLQGVEPVELHYRWRPQTRDPDDDMILEAAVNGRAAAIVTFNARDFGDAPDRFGVAVLEPGDILRRYAP